MNVREALSVYAHEAWSGWMKYIFSKTTMNADGTATIPKWAVERWSRQMNTEYSDMPDDEKDSDRAEADQMLAIGIERDREPFDIACKRIENAQRQGSLFAPESPADAYDQTNLDYQR